MHIQNDRPAGERCGACQLPDDCVAIIKRHHRAAGAPYRQRHKPPCPHVSSRSERMGLDGPASIIGSGAELQAPRTIKNNITEYLRNAVINNFSPLVGSRLAD